MILTKEQFTQKFINDQRKAKRIRQNAKNDMHALKSESVVKRLKKNGKKGW